MLINSEPLRFKLHLNDCKSDEQIVEIIPQKLFLPLTDLVINAP